METLHGKHKKDERQKCIQNKRNLLQNTCNRFVTKIIYNIKKSPKEFEITPNYDLIIRKVSYNIAPKMYSNINRNSRNVTFVIIMELCRNYFTIQSSKL